MLTTKMKSAFAALLCMGLLSACSQESIITGADLSTDVVNGETFIGLKTHLSTNNVQIVAGQIAVVNPNNPLEMLGQIKITSQDYGKTDVDFQVNASRLIKLPSLQKETALPNGTAFPVWGVNANNWYSIPLGKDSSKLYVNVDSANKKAVMGYALSTASVNAGVVGNLFTIFQGNGVTGFGGIYSGPQAGQSGVAIFADVSKVFQLGTKSKVSFADKTSESRKKAIQKRMIDLNVKKATLKLK